MNRLDKTEGRIKTMSDSLQSLWILFFLVFIAGTFAFLNLSSRLGRLEGTPQVSPDPIRTRII